MVTANLPEGAHTSGADRQPLLDVDRTRARPSRRATPAMDGTVPAGTFQPGSDALQALNPGGWASQELPLVADP